MAAVDQYSETRNNVQGGIGMKFGTDSLCRKVGITVECRSDKLFVVHIIQKNKVHFLNCLKFVYLL